MDKKYSALEITDRIYIKGDFHASGDVYIGKDSSKISFFGSVPVVQQDITDETSISELIAILKSYGLLSS